MLSISNWPASALSVHMCCTCTEETDVKRYVIPGSRDVIDKDHLFFVNVK